MPSVIAFSSVAMAADTFASNLVVNALLSSAAEASPESSSMIVTVICSVPSLALLTDSLSSAKVTLKVSLDSATLSFLTSKLIMAFF